MVITSQYLEGHLKSPDFFSVEKFPTASFAISKVIPQGDKHKVVGTMVIKNIAQELSFLADVKVEGNVVTATADITVDRSKFDVRYGSGSFDRCGPAITANMSSKPQKKMTALPPLVAF